MKGAIQGMDGGKLLIGLKLTGMENAASLEKILTDLYPPTYFLKRCLSVALAALELQEILFLQGLIVCHTWHCHDTQFKTTIQTPS